MQRRMHAHAALKPRLIHGVAQVVGRQHWCQELAHHRLCANGTLVRAVAIRVADWKAPGGRVRVSTSSEEVTDSINDHA